MSYAVALDMIQRALAGFRLLWWLAIPSLGVALVLATSRAIPPRATRVLRGVMLVATLAGAMFWAWQLRWLCDDAFISFRYADNLLRGHGLVYNVGERVEGYTNFLWTLLLAGAGALGFDIPLTSLLLGALAFAGLILVTDWLPSQADGETPRLPLPLAAMLCAAQYSMASFATSGLETMFGSLLALCALERGLVGRWFTAGTLGVAAAMAHPDLGILYGALGLSLLFERGGLRQLARYALPFVVFYLPYFAWRYAYYGDLFPNTYYAKSANLTYFSQGAVYLTTFLIGGGFWAALPVLGYGAWTARSRLLARYCLIGVPLFCVYIAKIGGDFMFGRLLCPIVPPLLVVGELAIARLVTRRHLIGAVLATLSLAVIAVPVRIIGPFEKAWDIADERTFYALDSLEPLHVNTGYFHWAQVLLRYFPAHKRSPRLSMYSTGVIGYYTGLPILDGFGLTDRVIAHKKINHRGRPGHEKTASAMYVVARDVDISDEPTWPPPFSSLARLTIEGIKFNLVHYDPKVIKHLQGKPEVSFTNYENTLKSQLRSPVHVENVEQIGCSAWFADVYYFSRVPSSPLRARMEQHLLDAGQAFRAKPTPPNVAIDLAAPRHVFTDASIHFEPAERARFMPSGTSFRTFPSLERPPAQEWAAGYTGAFADSFDPELGYAARGRLLSQPFALVGDVMELHVGGGLHSDQLRVSLLIDGVRIFSAGGCATEMLGRRLWQIAPFKGQQAVLEIVDDATWIGGHIMVDEITQWSPQAR